jgi:hypothetical protein
VHTAFIAAHHDGERRIARAFHAAAHRTVEKADAEGGEPLVHVARGARAHGRAIHDDHVGAQARSRPATTARKSSSAETQITTASQLPASSVRLVKAWHFSSWASSRPSRRCDSTRR